MCNSKMLIYGTDSIEPAKGGDIRDDRLYKQTTRSGILKKLIKCEF
ncbi:hypothetical protein KsCSTR_44090 [Candidatus Kuenenia stuttgartiensis]|uniref:Uncharacterized protein n=1 Tax=Kuenenia stuttgartiensis TaxID=174633 RepID=A0A6G7GW18_KUEST|nr:hypothetical protein KsCSTR_44090 [Candidatus Kuenenia stuttgartiensis]